jgi:hypothetical protein
MGRSGRAVDRIIHGPALRRQPIAYPESGQYSAHPWAVPPHGRIRAEKPRKLRDFAAAAAINRPETFSAPARRQWGTAFWIPSPRKR